MTAKAIYFHVQMFDEGGNILGQSLYFAFRSEAEHWINVHVPNTQNVSYYDLMLVERHALDYVPDNVDNPNPV